MPRCQWCRQESATADVCEWCKRPMTPGWAPSAAPNPPTAAVPANRLTFMPDQDSGGNDRVLLFSMLGIVMLTAVVYGISRLAQPPATQPVAQPAVVNQQAAPPPSHQDVQPQPATPDQTTTTYNWSPPPPSPPVEQPQYQPEVQPPAQPYVKNRKMKFLRDVTGEN